MIRISLFFRGSIGRIYNRGGPLAGLKIKTARRSYNMSRIRSRDTKPELIVRRMVHSMGFRFRLSVGALPGRPDLVMPKHRKLIFVHGCFWHQHRGCCDGHLPKSNQKYWVPKLQGNVSRYRKNVRSLRKEGWSVLTLWECEITKGRAFSNKLQRFLSSKKFT